MSVATSSGSLVSDLMDFVRREGHGRGDRLPSIRKLAETLGHGRNAIRDGLLEAQSKGFVKIEPRLGVFVQDMAPVSQPDRLEQTLEQNLAAEAQNLFHVVDARLLVEVELVGEAARLRRPEDLLPLRRALESVLSNHGSREAMIEADEEFHLGIARLAGNGVLLAFLKTLLGVLRPAKRNLWLSSGDRGQTDREHVELFRGLLDGDAERARTMMREHIVKGRSLLLEHLRTVPRTSEQEAASMKSSQSKVQSEE